MELGSSLALVVGRGSLSECCRGMKRRYDMWFWRCLRFVQGVVKVDRGA